MELYRNVLFLLFGEQIVVPLESDAQPTCSTRVKVSEKLYWCLQSTYYKSSADKQLEPKSFPTLFAFV